MPLDYKEFASKIKAKYPQYKDVDDMKLAQKMVEKYPEYKDQVQFEPIKKKEPTVSPSGSDPKKSSSVTQPKKTSGQSGSLSPAVNLGAVNPEDMINKAPEKKPLSNVFTGYPGKEKNEYRVYDGTWQRKMPNQNEWQDVLNEGSVNALNKQFGQTVKYSKARDLYGGVVNDKKDAAKKELDQKLSSINSRLIDKEEEAVVPSLQKQFPDFKFSQSGTMTDEMTVVAPNGEKMVVSLDNWTTDRDTKEAELLRSFIRVNSNTAMNDAQKQLDIANKERQYFDIKPFNPTIQLGEGYGDEKIVTDLNKIDQGDKPSVDIMTADQNVKKARTEVVKQAEMSYIDAIDKVRAAVKTTGNVDDREAAADLAMLKNDWKITKEADAYFNDISKQSKEIKTQWTDLQSYVDGVNNKLALGEITQEEYDTKYVPLMQKGLEDLKERSNELNNEYSTAKNLEESIRRSSAENLLIQESRGSIAGGAAYNFTKGLTDVLRIATLGNLSSEAQEEIVRSIVGEGTTEEYMSSEERSDITKVLFSLSRTMGQALTGGVLGKGAQAVGATGKAVTAAETVPFFASSYYEMRDQFDDPKFNNVSDLQKVLFSAVYGTASGILEKYGLTKAASKTPFGKNLTNTILASAIKGLPKDASEQMIKEAIEASVVNRIKSAGVSSLGAFVVEGATEASQKATEIALQEAFDGLNGNNYFDNGTGWEMLSDVIYEGYLGGLGGTMMNIASNGARIATDGISKVLNKEQEGLLDIMTQTEGMVESFDTYLKGLVVSGDITSDEASVMSKGFRGVKAGFDKIPSDIPVDQKTKAFDLIVERSKIEKEISGKEDNLVVAQKERIKEINTELQNISKDAVQKQTTDEGVLQPEGSEVGLQEVEQGNTEQEVVTEEGGKEAVAVESNDAKVYSTALEEAKAEMGKKGPGLDLQVSSVSEQEAQEIVDEGGKVFMTEDGLAGAYVKKDGYMGGLFKSPKSTFKDVAKVLQAARIKAGGYFMDAYATKLEDIYVKNGFRPVARLKFNEEFAPEGWNAEGSPLKSKPDVVFFTYDPEGTYSVGDGQVFDDYDAAYEFAKSQKLTQQPVTQNEVTLENFAELEAQAAQNNDSERIKTLRAARMVTKALKGVKVFIHNSPEEYQQALANASGESIDTIKAEETEGRSAGQYVNGEIHIDGTIGSARTVYHEAFHDAILKSGLAVDMAKGLSKIISDKNLRAQINEFISRYENAEQNEEMIAELGAIMAEAEVELTTTKLQQFKQLINKLAQKLGLPAILPAAADRQQVVDFINSMSKGLREGRVNSSTIIRNVDNNIPIENEYIETNGSIVSTNSRRKAKIVNTAIKESDLIDPKTLEGKPLEVVYYDNYTSSEYTLKNRVSGTSVVRKGEGGPAYSYRDDIRSAGIIAAFTNVTKGLNLIQGIASRNNVSGDRSIVGVALQNKETGHLGNKNTLFDIYNPNDGEIARAVSDGLISKSEAVKMLKDAVVAYEQTKKGRDAKSSLGFSSNDFNTLDEFFSLLDSISFERRGTFNAVVIPSKSDLKITKATKPHVVTWLEAGIPTLSDYYTASTEAYTSEAESHDIVKYIDPDLNKIGVPKGFDVSNKEMARAKEMGVEIAFIEDSLVHTSYPVVLFGKNIGIPSTFHSVRDMSADWNEPNPFFKAGRRKDTATPVRIPSLSDTGRSPKADSRKKQLAPKSVAVNKAKEKYDLSIERGNSTAQARESAINDLKKSDWYVNADDIRREDAVRELRSKLGLKEKKAPSVDKITGKPKDKKVIVNERTARNTQLRLEAKAARESQMDLKQKQRALIVAINQMKRGGLITVNQASALAKRLAYVNVDNPIMVERFLQYADRLFADAEYIAKIKNARELQRKIKRAIKNGSLQATTVSTAKAFSKINPSLVEDIDQYIEMADKVMNAVKPSRATELAVELKTAMDFNEVGEYTDRAIEFENEYRKNELLSIYNDLADAGVITKDMSIDEMKEVIASAMNETADKMPSEEKRAYIMAWLGKTADVYRPIIQSILKGVDPFSSESVTLTDRQQDIMREFLKLDVTQMDVRDAMAVVEAMDNFITNKVTDGLETVIARYKGAKEAKALKDAGVTTRAMTTFGTENAKSGFGRLWAQEMMSLKTMTDLVFRGVKSAQKITKAIGLTAYENGVALANRLWNNDIDTYYKLFGKLNPNGEKFMTAKNIYERGMYAALKRTVAGDQKAQDAELKRKIKLINDSITTLSKGGQKDREIAKMYAEVAENLGINEEGVTMLDIDSRVDPINRDAVNWWVQKWADNYNELADVSQNVYNTILERDMFYTPDKFSSISQKEVSVEDVMEANAGAFGQFLNYEYDKKSGVLMPSAKQSSMAEGRFLDLNFDMNNSKSLKAAFVDMKTATAIRQISGFLKSKDWESVMTSKEDRDVFRKKVDNYILRSRQKSTGAIDNDYAQALDKAGRIWASMGAARALSGPTQVLKQTIPVMINTLINAGRFDMVTSKEKNDWVSKIGRGISNRGLESQSGFEDANRLIDNAVNSGKAVKILTAIDKANTIVLKAVLAKPDVFVARSSFISYYKQYMSQNGLSTDIDFSRPEDANQDALDYAQRMVDRQQNVSDGDLAGELIASQNPYKKLLRNTILPFASFALNQKSRMFSDFSTMLSAEASNEDKWTAFRSAAGLGAEIIIFNSIAYGIKYLIVETANYFAPAAPEDDEEKEKQLWRQWGYTAARMLSDILSPAPVFDSITISGADIVWQQLDKQMKATSAETYKALMDHNADRESNGKRPLDGKEAERWVETYLEEDRFKFLKYDDNGFGGTYRITYDKLVDLSESYDLAFNGKFTDDRDQDKYILPEDRDILKSLWYGNLAYNIAGFPAEYASLNRRIENNIKKSSSISEKKYDTYNEVKAEKGRNLNKVETFLVKNMGGTKSQSGTERVLEEIDWIERNGGLQNQKQMDKYIEIFERDGSVGSTDLQKIQKLK